MMHFWFDHKNCCVRPTRRMWYILYVVADPLDSKQPGRSAMKNTKRTSNNSSNTAFENKIYFFMK